MWQRMEFYFLRHASTNDDFALQIDWLDRFSTTYDVICGPGSVAAPATPPIAAPAAAPAGPQEPH